MCESITFAVAKRQTGCSTVGSALRSGRRGRVFESPHPDNAERGVFQKRPFFILRAMKNDILNKYIWIVDTILKHGKISRSALNELWLKSADGDGKPIAQRTFFTYRRNIEECFKIDIECTKSGEYYIADSSNRHDKAFRNWILDSYAMREMMTESKGIYDRILVEDIPSARRHLPSLIEAFKSNRKILFSYKGYKRSGEEKDILLHPYMLKLYRQIWYVIGYKEKEKMIKTYALDRISELVITDSLFEMPDSIDPTTFFDDYFGITMSHADIKRVSLQVSHQQAKYFRALPLHHSQMEEIHDDYSIFTYKVKLTYDLVRELLSYGSAIKVIAPTELRVMITEELKKTLAQY